MSLLLAFKALFLGIVEGLTEFLPISSTGHLIVAGSLIGFDAESHAVFNIAIQLGAILAVVYEYRARFLHVATHLGKDRLANRFVLNLAIAFVPAAAIGLLLNDFIEKVLFNPVSVAAALVVGGVLILWIEKRQSRVPPRVRSVDDMRPRDALAVGLFQILALIPGTSRSGSTIMGGMVWGLDRKTATEFSFFLAVPIMVAASGYSILKNLSAFTAQDFGLIAIGFIAAFVSGLVAVKALLRFVSSKNFVPFAYYRIVFGGIILFTWLLGWVDWA
ncbi:undecaprenyl-diphosphate phosphatase [Eikenella sp. S3360]|uniref:Undecaprenyl-diphosphatase n=1 Tax=Eikenella glucosivorans TaxID=2766967 RepID=A0ABS0NC06_9NEIS|nr:undecaprenyl-diphosphate phosphatase [Eikenella glucosivorans]MBH5329816.1 undecaprenyl-diphosphate phosphatase [Eikenella glucosivorans]